MTHAISHKMDVYSTWIHLARTKSEWKKLRKSIDLSGMTKAKALNSIGLTERFVDQETGQVTFCVFIDKNTQTPLELIEVCAHEAAHVSTLLLESCSSPYDGLSEPLAYLIGWTTAWLWENCSS